MLGREIRLPVDAMLGYPPEQQYDDQERVNL